jgi:hypothetical protein
MSNAASDPDTTPLLRILSPALRGLERSLRNWLDATHRYPLSTLHRAAATPVSLTNRREYSDGDECRY